LAHDSTPQWGPASPQYKAEWSSYRDQMGASWKGRFTAPPAELPVDFVELEAMDPT